METVVLNIRRDKSLTGYAAPYRIFIDGREMTKVSSGEKVSLIIPKQKCILKISAEMHIENQHGRELDSFS